MAFILNLKIFSVGVRIEHLQEMINTAQYGSVTKLKLPPADYKLAYHNNETGRSCYTFVCALVVLLWLLLVMRILLLLMV